MSYGLYDVSIVFESDVIKKSKIGLINKCIYFYVVYVGYLLFLKESVFAKKDTNLMIWLRLSVFL